jgi:acetyl-CoA carboxylase biotin carboxyl carrier protein
MKKEKPPVADDAAKQPSPFDVRTVEALVALMAAHNLNEIDLRDGPQRLRLRRGARQVMVTGTAPPPVSAASAPVVATNAAPPAPAKKLLEIKSETVGTFYARPRPEATPYVQVGSRVEPDTVVCQIEAMKTFNEIPAGCRGVIAEILVQNEQYVEFGQVLFRVDPVG